MGQKTLEILKTIDKTIMKRIELDRSLYLPFGPIGADIRDGHPEYDHAREYGKALSRLQVKDEFDAYKQNYRVMVKRIAVKEAYEELNHKRNFHETTHMVMNWVMVPFLHEKFQRSYGKIGIMQFLVVLGMYHTYVTAKLSWGKYYAISKTMVQSFSWEFSNVVWKKALKFMLDSEFITVPLDPDLLKSHLERMANKVKHPVINNIFREDIYVYTPDGQRVFDAFLRHEIEYSDRIHHNKNYFQKSNVPKTFRDQFTREHREKIIRGKRKKRKNKAMLNKHRHLNYKK